MDNIPVPSVIVSTGQAYFQDFFSQKEQATGFRISLSSIKISVMFATKVYRANNTVNYQTRG